MNYMYGAPAPAKKKPMIMPKKMAADGDMSSPADMDAAPPAPDDSGGDSDVTLQTIDDKLTKIMMALGIPDDDDSGAPPMPGGDPNAPNPEMMPS